MGLLVHQAVRGVIARVIELLLCKLKERDEYNFYSYILFYSFLFIKRISPPLLEMPLTNEKFT